MFNVETQNESTRIKYPTNEDFHIIGTITKGDSRNAIIMKTMSPTEMAWLQNNTKINIKHFGKVWLLSSDMCYLYGDVDVENEDDIAFIRSCKWTSSESCQGNYIPANYDYESNTGSSMLSVSNQRMCRFTETFDNMKMFLFAYASLGKPENIAIYSIKFKTPVKND